MPRASKSMKKAAEPATTEMEDSSKNEVASIEPAAADTGESAKKKAPGLKRKPFQAFNAPKNKKTKDIIKQNQEDSPILRLPREIREKVWRAALGNRVIHIHRDHRFTHGMCEATVTESEAYTMFHSEIYHQAAQSWSDSGREDMRVAQYRHFECYQRINSSDATQNQLETLGLLRACRQLYVEANPILWATNTWSFNLTGTLVKWSQSLNATQRRSLKKVHLSTEIYDLSFPKSAIAKFSQLDELQLDLTTHQYHQIEPESFASRIKPFLSASTIRVIYCGTVEIVNDNPMVFKFFKDEFTRRKCIFAAKIIKEGLEREQANFKQEIAEKKSKAKKEQEEGFVQEPMVDLGKTFAIAAETGMEAPGSNKDNPIDLSDLATSKATARKRKLIENSETEGNHDDDGSGAKKQKAAPGRKGNAKANSTDEGRADA